MIRTIDYYLDRVTMYRLVLYVLLTLIAVATICGFLGILHYSAHSIMLSTLFFIGISWIANTILSWAFDAPTNTESVYITALILALIVSPAQSMNDYLFLFWAAVLSMASKYILAINRKHLFNPAAIALALTAYVLGESASWWVGTSSLMPFVLVGGLLIVRKLRFTDLAWSFFTTSLAVSLAISIYTGGDIVTTVTRMFFSSFLLFFGTIMLTEPLTLPPTSSLQMIYGALVGMLSVPQFHIGSLYFSPEVALVLGNMVSYAMSSKQKLILHLSQKIQLSSGISDFVFAPSEKLNFKPGQYMEWTLPHQNPDSRGNRRYFTIASSPTEDTIRIGVKFYDRGSSYKRALATLESHTPLVAAQLAGNFILPADQKKKLAFIAGGIGITPFRSMIQYLTDMHETRDVILIYTNRTADEIAYANVFDTAAKRWGLKVIYTVTDRSSVPKNWHGNVGRITQKMIQEAIPDFSDRLFYLSGPYSMITATEDILKSTGVHSNHVKKDFFPGLV